jgi:mono/diheme cytochrome c family protein
VTSVHLRRALLALLAPAAMACSDRIGKGWDWNRMRRQPRYEPYDSSAFFANGMAMRAPPAGTIAREAPLPAEDSAFATRALERRPADLRRGADRFKVYCAVCHGPAGNGGSVVGDNLRGPAPPSLVGARVRSLSAAQLYAVVSDGMGRMPAYGPSLAVPDRWAVVAYVLQLQHGAPLPADTAVVTGP